jgi:hypothetical protein
VRLEGNLKFKGQARSTYTAVVVKYHEQNTLTRHRLEREDNIKVVVAVVGCRDVSGFICLRTGSSGLFVSTVMNT